MAGAPLMREKRARRLVEVGQRVRDFRFYHPHLQIEDLASGELVPWAPNPMQLAIRAEIRRQEALAQPVRIIGLKSRRAGFSTTIQGTFAHRMNTRKRYSTITIAHEIDNAAYLFRMLELMQNNLPAKLTCPKERGHTGKMLELKNGSYARVDTANDKNAGRGSGARAIHASEYAHWPHQKATMRSIRNTVPMKPGTLVVVESTANGVGDEFHALYVRAREGRSPYVPLFFPWFVDPLNALAAPPNLLELEAFDSPEEVELRKAYPFLSADQLYWRRIKISADFDEDLEGFQQEYPANDDEAFLSTSRSFFGRLYGLVPSKFIAEGHLEGQPKGKLHFDFDAKTPALRILRMPEPARRYLLCADVAGGVTDARLEDFTDRREASDFNVVYVLDDLGRIAAALRLRCDTDVFGQHLFKLGRVYSSLSGAWAPIGVDVTGGAGWAVIAELRRLGYPSIWRDRERRRYTQDRKSQYGYVFTESGREIALATVKRVAREDPHLIDEPQLIHEMRGMIVNSRGKPEAGPNVHDDCPMAYAIGRVMWPEIVGAADSGAKIRRDPGLEATISQLATRGR